MSIKLISLASGSKGNSTLILSDSTAILVDAGISFSRISKELRDFGLTPSMLDGIVITHEHSDHISALPKMEEHTKIYAHNLTAKAIFGKQGMLKNFQEVEYYENGFEIGDIKVLPFRIPHDAAYPLAYTFLCKDARVSVATDIGRPTVGVIKNIEHSQVVLLEANYDTEMLQNGKYPTFLKNRILSNVGHLSNDNTAMLAEHLVGSSVKSLILGHLSENNNMPGLAKDAVLDGLKKHECSDIEVYIAKQNMRSEVFETN